MNPRDSYQLVREKIAAGVPVATATVVRTKGSTPREVGAKMVITSDWSRGTIGGGCGEAEVIEAALEMLRVREEGQTMVKVDLTEGVTETADRICGGTMEVLVEVWAGETGPLETLAAATNDGMIRVVRLEGDASEVQVDWHAGGKVFSSTGAAAGPWAAAVEARRSLWLNGHFVEFIGGRDRLLICGAGHIAQPLCRLGAMLDYSPVVVDDRPAFASSDRFEGADEVIARPFEEALKGMEIDSNTHAVLVTRGHRHDRLCLRHLLATPAHYIGMLGSRRRVRAVLDMLEAEGFAQDQLNRVWAPVGIDIGAHTPAEIAVSVMAELVALRRGRLGGHLRLKG